MVNYTLTIAEAPLNNGTTDPAAGAHVYAQDTEVAVTATPNGKHIFRFFISNGTQSFSNPLTVTMTEDITVTPHFANRMFMDVFRDMEKNNICETVSEPGTCLPGMDNFKSVARDAIRNLEK